MSMLRRLTPNVMHTSYWKEMGRELSTVGMLLTDRRVPWYAKIIPALAIAYMISPIDLIPEWLPIVGQMDDLAVIMLALRLFTRLAPENVVAEHQAKVRTRLPLLD